MKKTTRAWVRKAEADYRSAERLHECKPPDHDVVCFHCQQAAEKYLKAILEERGLPIPKTHDLIRLAVLLSPSFPGLRAMNRGLVLLNDYAVDARYPEVKLTKRNAESALRWASHIREACRELLGYPRNQGEP